MRKEIITITKVEEVDFTNDVVLHNKTSMKQLIGIVWAFIKKHFLLKGKEDG